MHPTRIRKWKQKHCSTLISLTGHIDFISGDKPHQGFSNTWSRFITHLFLLFVGPLSVLWPFRKLSLPPGRISFLGNCAKAVCITTLSHWTDISCYNYANSRLELYFSVWLSADMHEQKRALAVYSHALCMPSFHPLLCMQNFPKSVRQDTSALRDITVGTEASPHISGVS